MDPEILYDRIPPQSQLVLQDFVRLCGGDRKAVARALHILVERGSVYKFRGPPRIVHRDDPTRQCTCTPYPHPAPVYVRTKDLGCHPLHYRRDRMRKARTHAVPPEPNVEPEEQDTTEVPPPSPAPITLMDFLLDSEMQAFLPKNDRQGAPAPHPSAVSPGPNGTRAD